MKGLKHAIIRCFGGTWEGNTMENFEKNFPCHFLGEIVSLADATTD